MLIFSYRRMIMAYSPDFRKKVLETLSRGLSVRTTAALFGIHFTTIQNWKKHPEKAKTPQKRPPKKIRTEELLADIEMYPTDYLSERAKRFKCTPAAIRKAMLRNKFSKKRRYWNTPRLVRLNGIGSNVFRPASVSANYLWYILTRVASAKTGSGDMVIHLEDSVVTLSMIGMVKIKLML